MKIGDLFTDSGDGEILAFLYYDDALGGIFYCLSDGRQWYYDAASIAAHLKAVKKCP